MGWLELSGREVGVKVGIQLSTLGDIKTEISSSFLGDETGGEELFMINLQNWRGRRWRCNFQKWAIFFIF